MGTYYQERARAQRKILELINKGFVEMEIVDVIADQFGFSEKFTLNYIERKKKLGKIDQVIHDAAGKREDDEDNFTEADY